MDRAVLSMHRTSSSGRRALTTVMGPSITAYLSARENRKSDPDHDCVWRVQGCSKYRTNAEKGRMEKDFETDQGASNPGQALIAFETRSSWRVMSDAER
jgi:hypothetical protein